MKKVMFVVLALLITSACFALESGPSNKVGYTKISCPGGGYTPFGIAFRTWLVPTGGIPTFGADGFHPSDIIGDQASCGGGSTADRVIRQGGQFAFRNTACVWGNSLETNAGMRPSYAYWFQNRGVTKDVVIAGEADVTTAPDAITIGSGQFVAYSWRDPRVRAKANLGLLADGFTGGPGAATSDQVILQGGSFFYYNTNTGLWAGSVAGIEPGKAYWIKCLASHTGYVYSYDPTSSAGVSAPEGPKQVGTGSDIQKVAQPKTVNKAVSATN